MIYLIWLKTKGENEIDVLNLKSIIKSTLVEFFLIFSDTLEKNLLDYITKPIIYILYDLILKDLI